MKTHLGPGNLAQYLALYVLDLKNLNRNIFLVLDYINNKVTAQG